MVLWLGLGTFTAHAQVQSLVGELRSHKPHSTAKRKKEGEKILTFQLSVEDSLGSSSKNLSLDMKRQIRVKRFRLRVIQI